MLSIAVSVDARDLFPTFISTSCYFSTEVHNEIGMKIDLKINNGCPGLSLQTKDQAESAVVRDGKNRQR